MGSSSPEGKLEPFRFLYMNSLLCFFKKKER